MVIVDTSVWISYLSGSMGVHADWINRENGQTEIGVTDLILCEILQGTRSEAKFVSVRNELLAFDLFESGSEMLAIASARNYRQLRSKGVTIRKYDRLPDRHVLYRRRAHPFAQRPRL